MTRLLPRRRAFSLLEMLVVLVVIGLLATLLIARFGRAQERAYVAAMQSDLRNFAIARALHLSESETVPATLAAVTGFNLSEDVFEVTYQGANAGEWSLEVGHERTETRCSLSTFLGSASHRIECVNPGSARGVNQAPSAVASFLPEEPTTETEVTFSAAGSADTDGSIVRYAWNFQTGEEKEGGEVTHTFATEGLHEVMLTVTDDDGAQTVTQVSVTVGAPSPTP